MTRKARCSFDALLRSFTRKGSEGLDDEGGDDADDDENDENDNCDDDDVEIDLPRLRHQYSRVNLTLTTSSTFSVVNDIFIYI